MVGLRNIIYIFFQYTQPFKKKKKWGFPGSPVVKNLPANVGDMGFISGSGRFPGVGNGNLFQYSCLKNSMDREAWQAAVHGVAKEPDMS